MPDQTPSPSPPNGTHAVVIGGSMAGLLAARVLADHFDRVTVVERDKLPQGPELRNGVPQARHIHILLTRGKNIIEGLLPGLDKDLEAAGVPNARWGLETTGFTAGGWLCSFDSGITTRSSSRALLEWLVHRRIAENPKISFMEETQVNGPLHTADKARITGVQVESRKGAHEQQSLSADLAVDASGRDSKTPDWLQTLGYEQPGTSVVNSFLGYATRWYERPENAKFPWKILLVNARPPDLPRGGALFEVEDRRWMVSVMGANKDYPPTDEQGYLEFVKSLATPKVYEAIKDAKPLSPIYGYQRTANQQRHYERLTRMPENLIVMGDAACAFNPIYGQGMSVGALEALELDASLRQQRQRYGGALNLTGLNLRFQKRLAKVVVTPWRLATGEDLRYPGTEGARPSPFIRLVQKYYVQMINVLPYDTGLTLDFIRVTNLEAPPQVVLTPAKMLRVLRYSLSLRNRQAPDEPLVLEHR